MIRFFRSPNNGHNSRTYVKWRRNWICALVLCILTVVSLRVYYWYYFRNYSYLYPEGNPPSHDFRYIIRNERLCNTNDKTQVFIAIVSTPSNSDVRAMIRKTYGSRDLWKNTDFMKIGFLIGSTEDNEIQTEIYTENRLHGDIIQQDFFDSYRNLTYKALMFLHWTTHYCNSVPYVLKVDDDVMLDVFQLVQTLDTSRISATRSMICYLYEWSLVMRSGKWEVEESMLKDKYYPPYCRGAAVIFNPSVLEDLYQASFHVPFIPVDDAYISGYLVQYIGNITLIHEPSISFNHNNTLQRYRERKIPQVSLPVKDIFEDAWRYIVCRNGHLQRHLLTSVYKHHTADTDNCLRRNNLSLSFNHNSKSYTDIIFRHFFQ